MKTNQEYKNAALQSLQGRWSPAVLATLVYLLIAAACAAISGGKDISIGRTSIGGVLDIVIICPLVVALMNAYRSFTLRQSENVIQTTFDDFKENYARYLLGELLTTVFVCLWLLLFIIPGIIMAFAYAMTPFILKDNPELSCMDAIRKSRQMMRGHKMELFLLCLSFIGWFLLVAITCFVGYLWLRPYVYCTMAHFYEDLKSQNQ